MVIKLWKFSGIDEMKIIKRHKTKLIIPMMLYEYNINDVVYKWVYAAHVKNIISGLIHKEKA